MSKWHTTDFDFLPERAFQPRGGRGKFALGMTLEGGKGSDAPPPDPALIAAQIRSMGIQDSAIQQIMANAADMAPLQKEQMRLGLESARTAYQQSQDDRQYMLGRRSELTGMQDKQIQDAEEFNAPGRQEQLATQAGADVAQQASNARAQTTRALSRAGVNPSSGKALAMQNSLAIGQAAATAGAMNTARESARKEGYALTDRAANALSGYPSMGMQATGAGAGYGGLGLNYANAGLQGLNSGYGMGVSAAGAMGANATGMYGAQASYKNAQDQLANSSDPFGTILGAATGAATSYGMKMLMGSDRRLKTDIRRIGQDEKTGLPLYEFRYIKRPNQIHIGVMADEAEVKFPAAVHTLASGYKVVDYRLLGIEPRVLD